MEFLKKTIEDRIATVTFQREKVNPINEDVVREMHECFDSLIAADAVHAVIFTAEGAFFSYGLDVPTFVTYAKEDFIRFTALFAELYWKLFMYPKPLIAAINGHAAGGGCILATACDYRIMVSGQASIGLPEINFGSSLFPGSVEMIKHCMGERRAELACYTGALYPAEKAKELGLVDKVTTPESLMDAARKKALEYAGRPAAAFQSIKKLSRGDAYDRMKRKDPLYRDELVDIWYSEETWKMLQGLKIQ